MCVCGETFVSFQLLFYLFTSFVIFIFSYLGLSDTCCWHVFIICKWVVIALAAIGVRIAKRLEMLGWLLCCMCCCMVLFVLIVGSSLPLVLWRHDDFIYEFMGPWAYFENANMITVVVFCIHNYIFVFVDGIF